MEYTQMKISRPMKVYLSGPMRGKADFNFPLFDKVAAKLREEGHEVFSPADNDRRRFGADVYKPGMNAVGDDLSHAARLGLTDLELRRLLLGDDTAWICAHAEAIVILPDWIHSKGAVAEKALAEAIGLEVHFYG
jgi:hypothetical protein